MKTKILHIRNKIISLLYKFLVVKILFLIDPEKIHDLATSFGKFLGSNIITRKITSFFFNYRNEKVLSQKISGINFKNPVGLAAGFDKNSNLIDIIPEIGFGFEEIGSITKSACAGNPKPRLFRLKKSKALVVNYGLKNDGANKIFDKIKNIKHRIPLGISIAKTNCRKTTTLTEGTKDYLYTYQKFSEYGSYDVLNISCPNAFGGDYFTNPKYLNHLLNEVTKKRNKKPLFLKVSCDIEKSEIDQIIKIATQYKVDGFICGNLTKNRNTKKILEKNIPEKGGISGKVVEELSNNLISYIYKQTKGKFIIIGCGGIFSGKDAYKKIKLGASLVQLITGMIYEGPQLISDINLEITNLLKKDKLINISQAIGLSHKIKR